MTGAKMSVLSSLLAVGSGQAKTTIFKHFSIAATFSMGADGSWGLGGASTIYL